MHSRDIVQILLLAVEEVACAFNPRLRKRNRKKTVGFVLFYVGFLLGRLALVFMVVRWLYFQK